VNIGQIFLKHKFFILRAGLLALGIVLLVLGILQGDMIEIMWKATRVCLECIGIG
jgi:hypothetical protein